MTHIVTIPDGYRLAKIGEVRPRGYQFLDTKMRWNEGHRVGEAVAPLDVVIVPVRKQTSRPVQSNRPASPKE